MNKLYKIFIFIILSMLFCIGCDSRRNEILSHMLISPTMTETPEPPTATPTITPTAIPTLTPTPVITVENLDQLMFGDYDIAEYTIKARLNDANNDIDLIRAQTDLMELAFLREDYPKCVSIMSEINDFLIDSKARPSAILAKANYLHAQCAEQTGELDKVIDSLDKYTAYRPDSPLLSKVHQQIAYAYRSLEDYDLFRKYMERAESQNQGKVNEYARLDYAVSYISSENINEAITLLTELYDSSTDENIKAAADYHLGIAYEKTGIRDQTIARYQDGVNNFPNNYYSYLMLVWLLDNGQIVNDYQRGLVNYYVGQYALANDAFRRYIKIEPGNDGSSWYFIGLCQMYLADYEGAVTSFSRLIDDYPDNRYYVSAWDEKAYVQWTFLERYRSAASTLTDYVKRHPDQADSASFLYEAGRILERGNYLTDAAKTWARLIDEYPLYENSKKALFNAAICCYRTGDYEASLAYLNRLLLVSGIPEDQAQADLWIAKIYQKRADMHNYNKYLERASEQSKTGYYALRAAELAEKKPYLATANNYDLSVNLAAEKQIADQWMMLTFGLEPEALSDNSAYRFDQDYLEGVEYYTIGDYYHAAVSFEIVQEKLIEMPQASYAYLDEMVRLKIYNAAAYTSRQILTAAGLYEDDRTLDVPNYFNHIRFGTWYQDYTKEACDIYDISPFIIYAIMKQESMFNPWVSSSAGARGLMQIMPDTGAEIAKALHWPPNYTESDLNRVPVSVNFGSQYLKRVYNYFDQNAAAMLASYNGGSGNTQKWLNLSGSDPDLLFEVIRFQETRNYVQNTYRNAKIYERLYAK